MIEFRPWRISWNGWRVLLAVVGLIVLIEGIGLIVIWPDWDALRRGKVPESALMRDYKEQRAENPKLPRLQWTPLQKALPNSVKKPFILAEDSRFYEHSGVDFQAIQDAMEYNWKHKKVLLGASTISQQTAKNMFLSLSRNPLRKFHELFLTWLLEYKLTKAEILHIYLNVAEFGIGIYGIEAASRYYYHTSAYQLSPTQAAELAASLPSPKKHNPRTRTRFFTRHVARLSRTLQVADQAGTSGTALVSAELAKKLQELRELNQDESETEAPDEDAVATPAEARKDEPGVETPAAEDAAMSVDAPKDEAAVETPAAEGTVKPLETPATGAAARSGETPAPAPIETKEE